MGLLDDAIREHLDLKRRGGADPTELTRLEREAFGPASAEPAATGGGVATAVEGERPAEPVAEPEPVAAAEPEPVAVAEPEPVREPRVDQPTEQFTRQELEDAQRREPPAPEEESPEEAPQDELEETPDFLQETPEHDKLWFEQKPPKDFDF